MASRGFYRDLLSASEAAATKGPKMKGGDERRRGKRGEKEEREETREKRGEEKLRKDTRRREERWRRSLS